MASKPAIQLADIIKRVQRAVKETVSPNQMRMVGEYALSLIIKRTRLGYGVEKTDGPRYKLPSHSQGYIDTRKSFRKLSATTSPRTSNLTLTGQLLISTKITETKEGKIVLAPQGVRRKIGNEKRTITNDRLAEILAKKGYKYLNLSREENLQLIRFYRRTFGDLLKKRGLLRS